MSQSTNDIVTTVASLIGATAALVAAVAKAMSTWRS